VQITGGSVICDNWPPASVHCPSSEWSIVGQDTTELLTPLTVLSVVCPWTIENILCWYKYVWPHHSSHQLLKMDSPFSETLYTNSIFTQLMAQEDSTAYWKSVFSWNWNTECSLIWNTICTYYIFCEHLFLIILWA
jgi:hypothetical protein